MGRSDSSSINRPINHAYQLNYHPKSVRCNQLGVWTVRSWTDWCFSARSSPIDQSINQSSCWVQVTGAREQYFVSLYLDNVCPTHMYKNKIYIIYIYSGYQHTADIQPRSKRETKRDCLIDWLLDQLIEWSIDWEKVCASCSTLLIWSSACFNLIWLNFDFVCQNRKIRCHWHIIDKHLVDWLIDRLIDWTIAG